MARLHLLLRVLALVSVFASQQVHLSEANKVMMEYIGATGVSVTFDEVPIKAGIDFHFILSFAIDADSTGNYQNGVFSPYWEPSLSPQAVADVKAKHPGSVKVMASLSGWSLGAKVLRWYDPQDPVKWINNAFTSFRSLAETYHLDGIDVDYENFPKHNYSTFAYCMGELITMLKNQSVISVASIAPFYATAAPYIQLFSEYSDVIDYVNYQFYTDKVKTPVGYLQRFRIRAREFTAAKLLPSYEIAGRGIQGDAFFDALRLLRTRGGFDVNGVMIWSADASASDGFYFEKRSQAFLLSSTSHL